METLCYVGFKVWGQGKAPLVVRLPELQHGCVRKFHKIAP